MIVNKKDWILNIDSLLILPNIPEYDVETYEYNFKYVYRLDMNASAINDCIAYINRNNINEIIFVDYKLEYSKIMDGVEDISFGLIFSHDLASFSDEWISCSFDSVIDLYNDKKINKIGVLDINLFKLLENQYKNIFHIILDVPKHEIIDESKRSNIGIISDCYDPKNNMYNQLSAIKMNNMIANICGNTNTLNQFCSLFKVDNKRMKDAEDVIYNSEINLYINFCNMKAYYFFKSMDAGIPCLIGNNNIIEGYEELAKLIQINSDDNINEIAEKIEIALDNKEKILVEYKRFRKEYVEKAEKSIKEFCNNYNEKNIQEEQYEKLLTVGIPVYNVEEYVANSIQSVVDAVNPENTEIIIVNDGSTDNSEEVVLKYAEKYPNLIRYIKQENHGLGNVRNVIMRESKAKYIASIDSDDTINVNFFKEAEESLKEDVDIVICDWLSKPINAESYHTPALDEMYKFDNRYKKILYCTIMPSNCNKIVKKSLYQKIGLEFVENLKFEDFGTNPVILNLVDTINYINKPYYEYYLRENSIMRSKAGFDMIDVIRILDDRIKKYADKTKLNKKEFVAYVYAWRAEELVINQLYGLEENERNEMIDHIYDKLDKIVNEIFDNEYYNKLIENIDEPTKEYIIKRNKALLDGKLKDFIEKSIKDHDYKILTPALLLYNIDNR